ncbi:hypothetical protein BCS42_07100 [Crenothrix sp. D3]|nr:hypothetical protein BCS42_07100 [Crenothrix sp. D3]
MVKMQITKTNYTGVARRYRPAYRHNEDYILPFVSMLWGVEEDLEKIGNKDVIVRENLRYLFDYIITLENPLLRELIL